MQSKQKKTLGYILGALALVLIVGISYSYLSSSRVEKEDQKLSLTSGTMQLTFADNNTGVSGQLDFGESITKKFKIINDGTLESSLSIDWYNLKNTYLNGSLVYKLNRTDESGTLIETILDETNVPTSTVPITQSLIGEVSVPSKTTYYYDLVITLKDLLDVIQDSDLNAIFNTRFNVGISSDYRYYTLWVDPNGGTWNTFTAPQPYQLMHDDTKTGIVNPTRVGYEFGGWGIKGTSSTFDSGTFTMGISDTYLIAKWTPKKVTVTVDTGDGTPTTIEGDYGGTVTLEEPTKDGYKFENWTAEGGTVDGNVITITNPDGVTVTAVWSPKNYQYIVYHNKMTTLGIYAPVGVDTDKEEGEKPYNTEYTAPVKNFGLGFTAPTPEPLRITSNIENNKKTYEYPRNKFQLTINPDGGTGGTSSQEVFYEASITLEAPTRTGYNFTNWTKTSGNGTLADNTVTMGTDETVVQANWTAKTIPVELNANGGQFENASTTTKSTTVTYDSTYGAGTLRSLPTPTRSGYSFKGWYTTNAQTGGDKIEDSTPVTTTAESQTLYARWKLAVGVDVTLAVLQKSGTTKYTATPPNFALAETGNAGLFSMDDDYTATTHKQSYYFRGAVPDNYVKFGGFYWRIIRINGDGSLRMIYDGKQAYDNGTANDLRNAVSGVRYAVKDYGLNDDAKYVGYMYGPANTSESSTTHSTSRVQAQTNTVNSNAKDQVETWYRTNMLTNAANGNADLTPYLADAIFCNDRSISATPQAWATWENNDAINRGFNKYSTVYGSIGRTYDASTDYWKTPTPTFICPENTTVSTVNDKFTVSTSSGGNGKLAYPVGLITADEIVVAGSGRGETKNQSYYLYKSSSYHSLSFSPSDFNGSSADMFGVYKDSQLTMVGANDITGAIAPVINLNPEYAAQLEGKGTMLEPYTVPGVN